MSIKRNWRSWSGFLACALLTPVAIQAQAPAGQPGSQATATALGTTTPQPLAHPPALAPSRVAALEAEVARRGRLKLPMGEQVPVPESPSLVLDAKPPVDAAPPDVPGGPWVIEVNSPLNPGSSGLPAGAIGEPSVAQTGGTIFFTANWFAARTFANANPPPAAWNYIDPSAGMPDFCCDQDAIADRGRDMLLWTRLGGFNGRFVLSESTDSGITFCSWELNPGQLGYTGFYDQPLMALSNNYLYISANIFGPFHNVLLKISLDTLQDCPGGFGYTWWNVDAANGWGSLVQGATTTMYFGSHLGTNNLFTIWSQPDNSNLLFTTGLIGIPAFTFENGNGTCLVGGFNPCSRADSRVETGWVRQPAYQSVGEVGFMWNAREGGGFPFPYIEAATFRQDTLAWTGRPLVSWSNTAAQYPGASPNARGDLGLTSYFMGGTFFPGSEFRVDDDYNLGLAYVTDLFDGDGTASAWGDYVRNRSFLPTQTGWSSASHAIVSGAVQPVFSIVSRQRDQPGITRYFNTP